MDTVSFRLPWPPSVNHYYGRMKSGQVFLKEAGRLYRANARVEFARLGWPRIDGAVRVHLLLSAPDRRVRDIDNIRKAVYDAISDRRKGKVIVHQGIIPDDANIRADSAEFIDPGEGLVHVTITKITGEHHEQKKEKLNRRRNAAA